MRHITVHLPVESELQQLRAWAESHGWKCVHILLDRGRTPSQPMLTRHEARPFSCVQTAVRDTAAVLNDAGFPVTRIKIEAPPWNAAVPHSTKEARSLPPERYFEHHVKLLIDPAVHIPEVMAIAERHEARLSRNAFKQRETGLQERFVTQRCWYMGRDEAHKKLESLLTDMAELECPILEVEEEFVIFDSNLELDAGWPSNHVSTLAIP